MRKLNLSDAWKLSRIIKEAGVRKEISILAGKYLGTKADDVNLNEIGVEAFLCIIEGASSSKVEEKLYELIGDIKKIPPEEVGKMDILEFKNFISDLIKENDLKSFFNSASKLM